MTLHDVVSAAKDIAPWVPAVCSLIAAGFNYAWSESEIQFMPRWLRFLRGIIEKAAFNSRPKP